MSDDLYSVFVEFMIPSVCLTSELSDGANKRKWGVDAARKGMQDGNNSSKGIQSANMVGNVCIIVFIYIYIDIGTG